MKSVTDSMGTALERGFTHFFFNLEEEVGRFILSTGYNTIFIISITPSLSLDSLRAIIRKQYQHKELDLFYLLPLLVIFT